MSMIEVTSEKNETKVLKSKMTATRPRRHTSTHGL